MYLHYFSFRKHPFQVTPNSGFRHASASCREVLDQTFHGANEYGGLVVLTGAVGTGKAALIRALADDAQHRQGRAGCARRLRGRPAIAVRQWLRAVVPTSALATTMMVAGLVWLSCIPAAHAGDVQTTAAHVVAAKAGNRSHEAAADIQLAKAAEGSAPGSGDDAKSAHAQQADAHQEKEKAKGEASKGESKPTKTGGIPDGNADISQLLRLWGVFGAPVQSRCSSLHIGDLRCLADRGSFSMLERYNRPALLVLQRGGKRQTVLLSAIDKDMVTLVGEQGARQIARSELQQLWTGQFQVVWRVDSGKRLIQPGAVGKAVVWLRRRLDQVKGKDPDTKPGFESPVYDDALEVALKHFQSTHGLKPDGMVGPRTQIMLNGAVPSPGSPQLIPVKKK